MFLPSLAFGLIGTETRITTNAVDQVDPAISGNYIVYTQTGEFGDLDIYLYDLTSHTARCLTRFMLGNNYESDVDGVRVVYTTERGEFYSDIMLYDVSNGSTLPLTDNPSSVSRPRVDGDWVVWSEVVTGTPQIRAYRISTGEYRNITTDSALHLQPDISGNLVVWHDNRNGNWDIYSYDLGTGITKQLTSFPGNEQYVRVSGRRIVWEDDRNGVIQIYTLNLDSGIAVPVSRSSAAQFLNSIDGNHIVWTESRFGNYDIFLYTIPTGPQCGDSACNGTETCATCPADCGQCPAVCGDGSCNGLETCLTCPAHCGSCPITCGDGVCNGSETCESCPQDCGACVVAANDEFGTSMGVTLVVPAAGVLGNDTVWGGGAGGYGIVGQARRLPSGMTTTSGGETTAGGAPALQFRGKTATSAGIQAVQVSNALHGSATLHPDGSVVYTPVAGWQGTDTFTYRAVSGIYSSNVATVSVQVGTQGRGSDPVVLTGSAVPGLTNIAPGLIVAFRWTNGWEQVPVQIDERMVMDLNKAYAGIPTGRTLLGYCDTNTWAGADTNANFDADDELVFMARDAGARALPGHVVAGTGQELTLSDPVNGARGYVYLWRSDGTLAPSAGKKYVNYNFSLTAGAYKAHYNPGVGPNPENSVVSNAYWRTHFRDTWWCDELELYAGGASGVDVLDRHRFGFKPDGDCFLNESNICLTARTMFANKDGPVRAVRAYMGAGTWGQYTERDQFFYEKRQDVVTKWRFMALASGYPDAYDYSRAATGMLYQCNLTNVAVVINGLNETMPVGALRWEMAGGTQGTVVVTHSVDTDLSGVTLRNYYSDRLYPIYGQCVGDGSEIGCSGLWMTNSTPNLDPDTNLTITNHLSFVRVEYYEPPSQPLATAQIRQQQAAVPLAVTVAAFTGDTDGDGLPDTWEKAWFGSIAGNWNTDHDADGQSDGMEYVTGTDALSAASRCGVSLTASGRVSFVTVAAVGIGYEGLQRFYTLQKCDDLAVGNWTAIPGYENVAGTGVSVSYDDPEAGTVNKRFYRLKVWLTQ